MSKGRVWAIVVVALLHALLGYAFVTGLAYRVIQKASEDLKTFDVVEEPPPPEEEPPPPPESPQPTTPPPVVTPPPLVRVNTPPPPLQTTTTAPPPQITYTAPPSPPAPVAAPPPPPPPPPPPAPPRVVEAARARGSLQGLISGDDYPPSAQRNEEQGTVRVRLSIGANGRVSNCSVTGSSGSSALDTTTCRLLTSRARFEPARDQNGQPTADTHNTSIRWVLQD